MSLLPSISLFALGLVVPVLAAAQSTEYVVSFPNALHHEAEIEATFRGVGSGPLEIVMSRSSPGRYALAEFAKNVYHVRATAADGRSIQLEHPDTNLWRIAHPGDTVVFRYTVFGNHADGTYAGVDETHAHLNMPAVFAWARSLSNRPFSFRFQVPNGSGWQPATQLLPGPNGTFTAPNLEFMMDSPVELSQHDLLTWELDGAQFRIALHHTGTAQQANQYLQNCQKIVLEEKGIFGALPKYDGGSYTFLADSLPYVFGDGMEHRDSTSITTSGVMPGSLKALTGTASHEFFHSWNVRRLRPRSLEPFDFERANMSGELWLAEGFTQYYGNLVLARAGLDTTDELVKSLGQMVNAVLRAPGRQVHSAVEMSELAPFVDAAQSVDATNFGNTFISYYTYGGALAFGLDMLLREQFPGRTLDDYMRLLWHQHPDIDRPYNLRDLESALAELTGDAGFAQQFFDRHINGTEPLPFDQLVRPAGLLLRKAHAGQAWIGQSRGGRGAQGASLIKNSDGLTIQGTVLSGSPLYAAGLSEGDTILKWGKRNAADLNPDDFLQRNRPGDQVTVTVRTRSGQREAEVMLAEDPQLELVTLENAGQPVSDPMRSFRKAWLSSKANPTDSGPRGENR